MCREQLIARLIDGFHHHEQFRRSLIYIYGSSNNGFGTEGSDVDLCFVDPSITYEMIPDITDSIISILEEMKLQEIDNSRLRARIPVIRFVDPTSQLQCDLCFNNILPIRNTLLLKTYSSIDPRVRILGLIVKKWFGLSVRFTAGRRPTTSTTPRTKRSAPTDTFSCSSTSSRAPSVRLSSPSSKSFSSSNPHSQELPPDWDGGPVPRNTRRPQIPIKSYQESVYDTYFYCPKHLDLLCRFAKQNTMTVGELLLKFFYFYAFEFDYYHAVVSVRQRGFLDREEKCWRCLWKMQMQLCIEDPFEDDYDVAHVITPHTSQIILQCFAVGERERGEA